jgi:hypothetical protein
LIIILNDKVKQKILEENKGMLLLKRATIKVTNKVRSIITQPAYIISGLR